LKGERILTVLNKNFGEVINEEAPEEYFQDGDFTDKDIKEMAEQLNQMNDVFEDQVNQMNQLNQIQ